jgi:hypothetical protein
MGLLSILKKVKAKEREMRILMVYVPYATRRPRWWPDQSQHSHHHL